MADKDLYSEYGKAIIQLECLQNKVMELKRQIAQLLNEGKNVNKDRQHKNS